MKENQKSESVAKKPVSQNSQGDSKQSNSTSKKSPVKDNDKNNHEGEEFIKEGHGHNYSVPFAGEDGGTEEQSESKGKKSGNGSDKNQSAGKGKIKGEKSTI
jgi:hypothetical protein